MRNLSVDSWAEAGVASADLAVKWTDSVTAIATMAAALGTLITLICFGLQLRIQYRALRDQQNSSDHNLKAVSEQIAAQVEQIRYIGEQTRLQAEQAQHVAEQTKLLNQQAELLANTNRSVLYQNTMKEMQHLSGIFLAEPGLRDYFYDGKHLPCDSLLRTRIEILSEMFVDFMGFTLNTNILFDEEECEGWRRYFEYIATRSPSIQQYWKEHREWYESPVREVLDPIIARAMGPDKVITELDSVRITSESAN